LSMYKENWPNGGQDNHDRTDNNNDPCTSNQ
jgi:hypothetical protein